jgi:zinc finger-like protein
LFAVFHLLPQGIVLFHHSIRGALEVFTAEAAALQQQAGVTAGQLAGLVERHRFLRSVCMFHTLSEEEVSGLQGCTPLDFNGGTVSHSEHKRGQCQTWERGDVGGVRVLLLMRKR